MDTTTFDFHTQHLTQCEKDYLKLLIDPFNNPPVRAPSTNPRACTLYTVACETFYRRSNVASEYMTVEFQPDSAICQQSSSSLYPLTIREFTNNTTQNSVRYSQSNSFLTYDELDSNKIEYRLIAAGLKVISDAEGWARGGTFVPTYTITQNGFGDYIYTPPNQTSYYANDLALATVASATTGTPYFSSVRYEMQNGYDGYNGLPNVSFFIPSDIQRFESYWNNKASTDYDDYSYDCEESLLCGYRTGTYNNTGKSVYLTISAVAVYEISLGRQSYNKLGSAVPYPNYSYNSISKILNLLQYPTCYQGYLKDFNLSVKSSKHDIKKEENKINQTINDHEEQQEMA